MAVLRILATVLAAASLARYGAAFSPHYAGQHTGRTTRRQHGRCRRDTAGRVPLLPPFPFSSPSSSTATGSIIFATPVQEETIQREDTVQGEDTSTATATATVQDDSAPYPASVVFYDNVPDGIVCARGVCVLPDFDDDDFGLDVAEKEDESIVDKVLNSYIGPRALLAFASILYGTNFPLGTIMNDALPPSAATSARMVLASLALSPFLFKLDGKLAPSALLCGCFTALGYTTQSLSLVDTSPATVAFLGAATVIVCPTLEYFVNKKPMSVRDAPQTWLAATLCILGVGILELYDPSGATSVSETFSQVGFGDVLALLQAVGFGTSFFLTERMMRGRPDQALPITAVQVSTTALICMIWCVSDGWIGSSGSESFGLPAMFFEPTLGLAAAAVAWTGLATTALNRFVETSALGKMSSAEASVILATEPLWAALFAALWLSEDFGANDYIGGALIVLACVATSLSRESFRMFLGEEEDADAVEGL